MRTSVAILLAISFASGCGDSPSTLIDEDLGGADQSTPLDLFGAPDLAMSTAPKVAITFSGCAPDFAGNVIVVANGQSMAVTRGDAPGLGQIQLHLTQAIGIIPISSMDRIQNGNVINVIANNVTSTNISSIKPDPIKGTLTIHSYDEAAGKADLEFDGVTVENVSDHTLCKLDGTLVTHGKTF